MKKRKIKLFASVASLAMVAAVMGVGVWAATQQSVSINSTVGFQATGITGTIALDVDDAVSANVSKRGGNAIGDAVAEQQTIATFALADAQDAQTQIDIAVSAEDHDGDGFFTKKDLVGEEGSEYSFKYTFTFNNTSTVDMYYTISATTVADWEVDGTVAEGTKVTPENKTATITFKYTGTQEYNSIDGSTVNLLNIPSLTIGVASTPAGAIVDAE